MFCTKFGWNWPCGSGEEAFFHQYIFTLVLLSLLGKQQGPYFNKLESPLPKDALYQVRLKLARWFWRRRKYEKFTTRTTTTTTTTDNGQIVIRKAHLSLCFSNSFFFGLRQPLLQFAADIGFPQLQDLFVFYKICKILWKILLGLKFFSNKKWILSLSRMHKTLHQHYTRRQRQQDKN